MMLNSIFSLFSDSPRLTFSPQEKKEMGILGDALIQLQLLKRSGGHLDFIPCPNEGCFENCRVFLNSAGTAMLRECRNCNEICLASPEETESWALSLDDILSLLNQRLSLTGSVQPLQPSVGWFLGRKESVSIVFVRQPASLEEKIKNSYPDAIFIVPTEESFGLRAIPLGYLLVFKEGHIVVNGIEDLIQQVAFRTRGVQDSSRIILHNSPLLEVDFKKKRLYLSPLGQVKSEEIKLDKTPTLILKYLFYKGQPDLYETFFSREEICTAPSELSAVKARNFDNAVSQLNRIMDSYLDLGFPQLIAKSTDSYIRLNHDLDSVKTLKVKAHKKLHK